MNCAACEWPPAGLLMWLTFSKSLCLSTSCDRVWFHSMLWRLCWFSVWMDGDCVLVSYGYTNHFKLNMVLGNHSCNLDSWCITIFMN